MSFDSIFFLPRAFTLFLRFLVSKPVFTVISLIYSIEFMFLFMHAALTLNKAHFSSGLQQINICK